MLSDINKAISLCDKVFGYSPIYSDPQIWIKRNLFRIYFHEENAFMAVEKREETFHIWLMGALEKSRGSGKALFRQLSRDIRENSSIEKITVSTIPKKFENMYNWLLRIGFTEFKRVDLSKDDVKIYLEINSAKFSQIFDPMSD